MDGEGSGSMTDEEAKAQAKARRKEITGKYKQPGQLTAGETKPNSLYRNLYAKER